MSSVSSAPRLHALDGLRGIAATLVLGHHLGASGLADKLAASGHRALAAFVGSAGASGVELFFVLSGVVLLRPYLRYGRPMDVTTYLRRRAVRLMPPYIAAWVLGGLAASVLSHGGTWYSATTELPPFEFKRWFSQIAIVYFGDHYNWAWWSLTVEVLFYLLIPLLVPLLRRLHGGIATSAAILGGSLAFSLLLGRVPGLPKTLPNEIWRFLVYSPCFCAGVLLARRDYPRAASSACIGAGIAMLGVYFFSRSVGTDHAGYGLLYAGIVSRALNPAERLSSALGGWHLVWLGERSYSLFLTHCSVIVLVYDAVSAWFPKGAAFMVTTRLLAVPLSLFVAMLLFSFVERLFAHGLITKDSFWPVRLARPTADLAEGAAVVTRAARE